MLRCRVLLRETTARRTEPPAISSPLFWRPNTYAPQRQGGSAQRCTSAWKSGPPHPNRNQIVLHVSPPTRRKACIEVALKLSLPMAVDGSLQGEFSGNVATSWDI